MALRTSWKGFLRLSLVSVPVRAYSAAATEHGRIQLHQLHDKCHSRIRYQKVCPIHGEVSNQEIVSGYEYAKGQYVVVDDADLEKARTPAERAISIDRFVPPDSIDPFYYDGRGYYLLPDGPAATKPYALLCKAMQDEKLSAIALVVLTGREQLAVLRADHGMMRLSLLNFVSQVKPAEAFRDEVPDAKASAEELRLAKRLIGETTADKLDLSRYHDTDTEKLSRIIEAKVAGHEVVAPRSAEPVQVINLMDALRKSVAQAKGTTARRPARKLAASKRSLGAARRKSS